MDVTRAVWPVPMLRRTFPRIAHAGGACGHPITERRWKRCERGFRNLQSNQTLVGDDDRHPRFLPAVLCCRQHVGTKLAQELASLRCVLNLQQHVASTVRAWPASQDDALYVFEFQL